MALMNNFDMAVSSTATAMDSMGSATRENEIYLNSVEGRMTSLKTSMEGFWISFINSDMLKDGISALQGVVNALNWLQESFGSLGLTIGTLSTAFLMFTNNPLKTFAQDIVYHRTTLGGLSESLNHVRNAINQTSQSMGVMKKAGVGLTALGTQLKAGFTAIGTSAMFAQLKVMALQSVMSFGLSFAITGIINVISGLVKAFTGAEERIEAIDEKSKALSDTLKSVEDSNVTLGNYERINKQLLDANLSEERRKELNEELVSVKEQLYNLDDSAGAILDNTNLGYEEQLELLRLINEEKLRERAEELDKQLGNGFWNRDESKNAEESNRQLEYNIELLEKLQALEGKSGTVTMSDGSQRYYEANQITQAIQETTKAIDDNYLTVERYNSNVEILNKANIDHERTTIAVSDATKEAIASIKEETKATQENTKAKSENDEVSGVGGSSDIAEVTKAYGDSINKAKEYWEMLQKVNEAGSLTPELISELATQYPELGSRVTDLASVQEYLNDKIAEQGTIQEQTYQQMMEADNNYYNNKMKNDSALQNSFSTLLSAFVTNSGEAYNADLSNYNNLSEMKADLTKQYGETVANLITNFVTAQAEGYDVDLDK